MRLAFGPPLGAELIAGVAGGVHGLQTDRWRTSAELEHALARIPAVPRGFGDWKSEDVAFEADDMARAGIKGCLFRTYQNPRSRQAVSLLLVCGRGGPISVHTPDVCYAGAGYRQLADAQTRDVDWGGGQKGTFRVARFAKPGVVPEQLEIYWAWSRDGRAWEAPDNPRLSLARSPALYKLYAIRSYVAGTQQEDAAWCPDFLSRALPEIGRALAATEP
jgi:hypothetical protein